MADTQSGPPSSAAHSLDIAPCLQVRPKRVQRMHHLRVAELRCCHDQLTGDVSLVVQVQPVVKGAVGVCDAGEEVADAAWWRADAWGILWWAEELQLGLEPVQW